MKTINTETYYRVSFSIDRANGWTGDEDTIKGSQLEKLRQRSDIANVVVLREATKKEIEFVKHQQQVADDFEL